MLCGQANLLELASQTLGVQADLALLMVATATALVSVLASIGFVGCLLGEVRELVGAQQLLFAFGHLVKACIGTGVDGVDDVAIVEFGLKATLVLNIEEEFPSLLCQRCGEHLHVVAAAGGVSDLVEVALLLQHNLLVAGDALTEVVA